MEEKELLLYKYVDGVNDTPFPSAEEQISLTTFTYNAQRMAATPTITSSVNFPKCLDNDWDVNVFAEFRGEKYYIRQIPSSSKDNKSVMYKHDITLYSERFVLENIYLYDVDKNDDTNVIIRCDLADFVKVINRSFEKSKLPYIVSIDNSVANTEKALEVKDIALDKVYLSVALQEIYNQWEIPYYFEGHSIIIKDHSKWIADTVLEYGYDKSLLSVKKNNANFRKITRCSGYGSDRNIPFFYPNLSQKGEIDVEILDTNTFLTKDKINIVDWDKFKKNVPLNGNVVYKKKYGKQPRTSRTLSNINFGEKYREIGIKHGLKYDFSFDSEIKGVYVVFSANIELTEKFECGEVKNSLYSTNWSYSSSELARLLKSNLSFDTYVKFDGYTKKANVQCNEISSELIKPSNNNPTSTKISFEVYTKYLVTATCFISADDVVSNGNYPYFFNFEVYPTFWKAFIDDISLGKITHNVWGNTRDIKGRTNGFSSFTISNASFHYLEEKAEQGWFLNGTKKIDLQDIGVNIKTSDAWTYEGFKQIQTNYITPAINLMPPIYRNSLGKEKFYNAKDNTYLNENGEYYDFETEWNTINQNEHIQPFEEIYPTITNMVNADNIPFDEILDVAFDDNDNNEVDEEGNFLHPYFYVKIPKFSGDFGFNLFEHKIVGGNMQVSFTSGDMSACVFEIMVKTKPNPNSEDYEDVVNPILTENGVLVSGDWQQKTKGDFGKEDTTQQNSETNSIWLVLQKDDQTFGTTLPDSIGNVIPKKGDKFVLLNIEMPQKYIDSAEEKLRQNIIQYMWENNSDKWNFNIDFSRIFLKENPLFVNELSENAKVRLKYDNIIYDFYVNDYKYEVKANETLPKITIGLADTITVSRSITQSITDGVMKNVQSQLGGVAYIDDLNEQYLRKRYDETMPNNMTFEKNIISKGSVISDDIKSSNYTNGEFTGSGFSLMQEDNGDGFLIVDKVKVRKKLEVYELVINQLKAQGGTLFVTSASMECNNVETYDTYYRCYFDTKNGSVYNQFKTNDLARCQKFGAISKYYWRKVVGVGDDYIDLSINECDNGSDIPTEGDVIIQLGNTTNIERQSAIELSSNGEYSPSFIMYSGINDFSLDNKQTTGVQQYPNKYDENGNIIEEAYPQFFSFGSMYFGSRDKESNYISYQKNEQGVFEMVINAKTTFKSGTQNISDILANIDNSANEANNTANQTKEDLANITIGGDNIILGADKYPDKDNAFTLEFESDNIVDYFPSAGLNVNLEAGQIYTFTAYSDGQWQYTDQATDASKYVVAMLEGSENGKFYYVQLNYDAGYKDDNCEIIDKKILQDGRICTTFKVFQSNNYIVYLGVVSPNVQGKFWQVQIEKGNIPSDWKPTSISNINSATNQTKQDLENLTIGGENIVIGAYKYPNEDNAFVNTSDTNDDYTPYPGLYADLIKGQKYTLTAYTDGLWNNVQEITDNSLQVDCFLLLDYHTDNIIYPTNKKLHNVRMLNDGRLCSTITAPATGRYYIRFDIDYKGNTRKFWQVQIEKGYVPSDWKPAKEDTTVPLYEALQGTTEIEGGLINTSVIMVKDQNKNIKGGISGQSTDNIAFWSGGTLIDAINGNCNVIIRKDGTAKIGSFTIENNEVKLQLNNGDYATMSPQGIVMLLNNGGKAIYDISGVTIIDKNGDTKIKLIDDNIDFEKFRKLSEIKKDIKQVYYYYNNRDVSIEDTSNNVIQYYIEKAKNIVNINLSIQTITANFNLGTISGEYYYNMLIYTDNKDIIRYAIKIGPSGDDIYASVVKNKKVTASNSYDIFKNANKTVYMKNGAIIIDEDVDIKKELSDLSIDKHDIKIEIKAPADTGYTYPSIMAQLWYADIYISVEEPDPQTIIGTNGLINYQSNTKFFGAYLDSSDKYHIEAKGNINLNGKTY